MPAKPPEGEERSTRAGNINLEKIYDPEDIKDALRATAAANRDFIEARRGKMTFEEIRELAALTGLDKKKFNRRGQGVTLNAEEMFAARTLLLSQAQVVKLIAEDLDGKGLGVSDADRARFAEAMARLAALQEYVAGATAEAGRALAQFRMIAESDALEVKAMLEKFPASLAVAIHARPSSASDRLR
jgi:hypothetical protein